MAMFSKRSLTPAPAAAPAGGGPAMLGHLRAAARWRCGRGRRQAPLGEHGHDSLNLSLKTRAKTGSGANMVNERLMNPVHRLR